MHHLSYKPESGLIKILWVAFLGGILYLFFTLTVLLVNNQPDLALLLSTRVTNMVYFGSVIIFVALGLWHSLKSMGRKKKEQARYYSTFSSLVALIVITLFFTTFSHQIALVVSDYIKQLGNF